MEYFFVRDGKVLWLNENEFEALGPKQSVHEVTKDMTSVEFEAFKKHRYEHFIKPLFEHKNKPCREVISKRKSWMIDPTKRKK